MEIGKVMKKSKFLFLIGVEGSGHHAVHSLLKDYYTEPHVSFQQSPWHNSLIKSWKALDNFMKQSHVFNWRKEWHHDQYLRHLNAALTEVHYASRKNSKTIFIETCSFPFDNPRSVTRSPDLYSFYETFKSDYDIRFIKIDRDLKNAIKSTMNRNFTNLESLQSRILTWNSSYISHFYKNVDAPKISFDLEKIHSDPHTFISDLELFIDDKININLSDFRVS